MLIFIVPLYFFFYFVFLRNVLYILLLIPVLRLGLQSWVLGGSMGYAVCLWHHKNFDRLLLCTLYSLTIFSLAKSVQLILELSVVYRLVSCLQANNWLTSRLHTQYMICKRNVKLYSIQWCVFHYFFKSLYISIITLMIIENRALWLARSFASSCYNHHAVIITLKASSFQNGSQICWCFRVGNWSIILFSQIIINVVILKQLVVSGDVNIVRGDYSRIFMSPSVTNC